MTDIATEESHPAPERFRSYLIVQARMRLHPLLRRRLDASDIVQRTLVKAHEARDEFRGTTAAELVGWLRRILAHELADAMRELKAAKRDVARERPLDAAMAESSVRVERWLATEQTDPGERAVRHEEAALVADALATLPEPQQEAVVLRHWQGLSLEEIAGVMERSPASVAGLLRRGLRALRGGLAGGEAR